jgi:hypothetical protein
VFWHLIVLAYISSSWFAYQLPTGNLSKFWKFDSEGATTLNFINILMVDGANFINSSSGHRRPRGNSVTKMRVKHEGACQSRQLSSLTSRHLQAPANLYEVLSVPLYTVRTQHCPCFSCH